MMCMWHVRVCHALLSIFGYNTRGAIFVVCVCVTGMCSLSLLSSHLSLISLSLSPSLPPSLSAGVFLAFPDLSLGDNNESQSSKATKRTQPYRSSRSVVGAIPCMTATIEENPVVSARLCDNKSSNQRTPPVPLGALEKILF